MSWVTGDWDLFLQLVVEWQVVKIQARFAHFKWAPLYKCALQCATTIFRGSFEQAWNCTAVFRLFNKSEITFKSTATHVLLLQLLLHSLEFCVQQELIQKIMIFCGNRIWKSINEIIPHQSVFTYNLPKADASRGKAGLHRKAVPLIPRSEAIYCEQF